MKQLLTFDIDTLVIFVKLVECRSLSKAAALLGMPKSTVSRKISKLESDLGIRLLRKNTHQITVTDLGERVYSHSLKILSEANEVRALIEGNLLEPQGELRAALPIFMGIDYAARVGGTFLQRYPQAQLDIRLVNDMVHPVNNGYDVVFGIGPLQDSTLIARKAFTLECFLCASRAFLDRLPQTITTPSDLDNLPFIDFDYYGQPRTPLLTKGKRQHNLSTIARARANNFQISKDFLLRGLGFGIMPKQIICSDEIRSGMIVPILPDWELEPIEVYMIYPYQLTFSNLISAFYETALEIVMENSKL